MGDDLAFPFPPWGKRFFKLNKMTALCVSGLRDDSFPPPFPFPAARRDSSGKNDDLVVRLPLPFHMIALNGTGDKDLWHWLNSWKSAFFVPFPPFTLLPFWDPLRCDQRLQK